MDCQKHIKMIQTFSYPKYYSVEVNEETGAVRVFSSSKHAKGRELLQHITHTGYLSVKLNNRGIHIHRLVALFYLGKRPHGLCVNHKDANKLNNRPNNLEYVTISENTKHSIRMGMHVCNRPEEMPTYIDGRTVDRVKYKKEWYQANRVRLIAKAVERQKRVRLQKGSSLTVRQAQT